MHEHEQFLMVLKEIANNKKVLLPSGIQFKLEDDVLRMDISKAGICANMQEDDSAFEGWAICLKVMFLQIQKVIICWDTTTSFDKNQQLHYNRFQYRVRKFIETYAWAENGSPLDFDLSGENPFVNFPTKPADESAKHKEALLERDFVAKNRATQTFDVTNHQLPVGIFNTKISSENRIMPGGNSQIDIWAISNETLHIFELKEHTNTKIGIISELMFYVNIMNDIKNRIIQYPENAAGNKHRDFDKLYEAFYKGTIQKINGQLLTKEIHPLITPDAIKLMNESQVLRKEHITYSHCKIP